MSNHQHLAAHTKTLDIVIAIFSDRATDVEATCGANRMRIINGTRLETACIKHTRDVERNSPPVIGSMIRQWRPMLQRGAQTAYVGVLLSMLDHVENLSLTILCEEGHPRKSTRPLERLFGLSVGTRNEDKGKPRPYLPLLPSMRRVTWLKTSGANIALLCLGFDDLRILEVDFLQSYEVNSKHASWRNELVILRPSSLPQLQSIVIHSEGDNLMLHAYCIRHLFDKFLVPRLLRVDLVLSRIPIKFLDEPYSVFNRSLGDFHKLIRALILVSIHLQDLRITVSSDRSRFNLATLHRFQPFDLTKVLLLISHV
jgi:hypothetical protein